MPDILKIAGIYTAIILGAGFASGQEILSFFINYGRNGFYGLVLSGFIFSLIGYMVLKISYVKKISSAESFFRFMLGKLYFFIEYIIAMFLFISYTTMLSATGACFKQQFNLPGILGIILMVLLCFVAYLLGVDFIAKINFVISPILFLGGISVGLFIILNNSSISVFLIKNKSWIKSAILYSAYNLITGICVIIPMLKTIKNKNHAKFGAVLGLPDRHCPSVSGFDDEVRADDRRAVLHGRVAAEEVRVQFPRPVVSDEPAVRPRPVPGL